MLLFQGTCVPAHTRHCLLLSVLCPMAELGPALRAWQHSEDQMGPIKGGTDGSMGSSTQALLCLK